MPMSKAGKKIMANLKQQYGEKKGEGIFYAMENKGEIPGMKKKKGYNVGGQVPKQPSQRQAQQISAFNRSQARAMNASRQTPAGPGGMQALRAASRGPTQQARRAPTRPSQVGAMQAQRAAMSRRQGMSPADAQANQRNMAQAQRVAASGGPAQQARRAPTRPSQVGAMQAQRAAMAQAQKMAPARGPAQQARRAPAGGATPGARQMSAVEAQRTARTRPSRSRPLSRRMFNRRRGFAEGGMVKSTGKLNTGIKKCGE